MKNIVETCFFLLLIILQVNLLAKKAEEKHSSNIIFHQLSQEQGLSQNSINDIIQDRHGFLWVATEKGLNRYDGYQCLQLYGIDGLPNDQVTALLETENGMIWVGTRSGGLARLNPETLIFDQYHSPGSTLKGEEITLIFEDPDGRLWVGDRREGLHCLDRNNNRWHAFPGEVKGLGKSWIYEMFVGEEGNYWVATSEGLYEIEQVNWSSTGEWQGRYIQHNILGNELEREIIYSMCPNPLGGFWIGMWEYGLISWEKNKGIKAVFHANPGSPNSLVANRIRNLMVDRQGQLWICNFDDGLSVHQAGTQSFRHFRHEAGNAQHLKSDFTTCVFEDQSGIIWVGTYGGGLNHYSPYREKFMRYQQQANTANSLSNDYVFAIQESRMAPPGSLWIGTHGNGLNLMLNDPMSGNPVFRHFPHEEDNPISLSYDAVLALTEDHLGNLWVGTYNGLNRLPAKQVQDFLAGKEIQARFDQYFMGSSSIPGLQSNSVWSLLEDRQQRLWIGTHRGLHQYFPALGRFEQYAPEPENSYSLSHSSVDALFQDSQDRLWVGTHKGLNLLLAAPAAGEQARFIQFVQDSENPSSLQDDWIYQIIEDQQGRIWIGTRGKGLHVLMEAEPIQQSTFVQVTEAQGLCSNAIKSLEVDQHGVIWVSTIQGLCAFHPDSLLAQLKTGHTSSIRVFDAQDGLQGSEFSDRASTIGRDGRLYFGGLNGFNAFYPEEVRTNPHSPEVYLTGIRILDRDILVGGSRTDGKQLLTRDLPFTEHLSLSYRDYSFTLFFSALDFTLPEKNQYAYRLDGFDEQWRRIGTERTATYTNLDPGDYTFRIKASNHDGYWSTAEQRMTISISPPPWKTWWAYTLYGLAILGAFYAYLRYQIREREKQFETRRQIESARQEEREQVRKRTAADFHDELGHKMTKISLFVELAKRTAPAQEALQKYLDQVSDQTQVLSEGIRDFIWVLDPDKDSLLDAAFRLKDFGEELFGHTGITFRTQGFSPQLESVRLPLHMRRHLVLLFKEAMNNTLKYANAKEVHLIAEVEEGQFLLSCKDNGQGFESGQKAQGGGYGLKNMQSRAEQLGGHLKIHSGLNQGTTVSLTAPIPHLGD